MKKGENLVIVGCGGVGAPAAMLSRKLMPEVNITLIRAEDRFIVRWALPHVVAGLVTGESIVNPDTMFTNNNINVIIDRVETVNREDKPCLWVMERNCLW